MFFLKDLPTARMLDGYAVQFPSMQAASIAAALTMLRDASVLMRRLDAYFTSRGLSQTQFLILIVLDREHKPVSLLASEIAEKLDISRPIVTNTLKGMILSGWLHKNLDPSDGRIKPIELTPAGRAKLHELLPGYFEIIQGFMRAQAGVTPPEGQSDARSAARQPAASPAP